MTRSIRDKIQECQTELLQDFFETQMMEKYPTSWKQKVENVAISKQNSSHSVYKQIKEKFDAKGGADGITIRDFDVTALVALIRFDFSSECCPDNRTRRLVGHITIDRNGFSHISDYKDVQHIFELEETAVVNMKELLTHLQDIGWDQPVIFRKYLGTGHNDGQLNELSSLISDEQSDENVNRTGIRQYLQTLQLTREERTGRYVGLSYNQDGKRDDKKFLDELIKANLENSHVGMRIVAEGGCGKSWTLSEIAGRYAQAYLDNDTDAEMTVPVLIEMGKLYKDCSSISKKIAELLFNKDEGKVIDFYKNHKIVLLIDAMDEARVEIQDDVSKELASLYDIPELRSNITLVCASRKSCIDKYPITIPCYAIKELDDEQIIEYLKKTIPKGLVEKSEQDWIGDNRKEFLSRNRTPFYISCYVDLICETGDHDFVDTTQLIEKFLNSMIEREIRKRGFHSDKATFINFLKELCRLLDLGGEDGEKVTALPENDVIRELSKKIVVEEGYASIKAVGRKLVEIQILARDDEEMLLSFAHQNYKEYINRKYPIKKYRRWS